MSLLLFSCSCGGPNTPPEASVGGVGGDGGVTASASDAGGDGGNNDGKPFAGSVAEATELISNAIDSKHSEIGSCVRDFRKRKKTANRVAVSVGIDQEGKVLGVTSKGKEDNELKSCVQGALKGAPFPRSHAGVITVTKSYEDIVQ